MTSVTSSILRKSDLVNVYRASPDSEVKKFARDTELVERVYKVLNVSLELLAERAKGRVSGGALVSFAAAKEATAIAALAPESAQYVQFAAFLGSQIIATAEMGKALTMAVSPARAGAYVTVKFAEKLALTVGLANVDKCQAALFALTVSAGVNVFTCVATGGAPCILGAASFAAEALNTYAQCR